MFESERRDLSHVPRWGIIRVNRRQSVAEHSYYVTCYGLQIAELIDWPGYGVLLPDNDTQRLDLVRYLLRHDESECLEGDIPGPVKRLCGFDSSKLKERLERRFGPAPVYTPEMKAIKKAADLIDECFYLAGELNSGNQFVRSSLQNAKDRLARAIDELPCDDDKVKNSLHLDLLMRFNAEETMTKDVSDYAEKNADHDSQRGQR